MSILEQSEEASTPVTPSAGRQLLYPKSDGWYYKNAAGVEVRVANAADLATKAALAGSASQAFEGSTLKAATGMAVGGATPGAGGIAFPPTAVAVADPNTQDDYKEYTSASAACTGAITTAAIWKATKVGNTVTLTLPVITGIATAVSNFAFGEALPSSFRPAAPLSIVCVCLLDNAVGTAVPGMVDISAGGVISIYRDATFTTAFTNGANAGIRYAVSVSWTI